MNRLDTIAHRQRWLRLRDLAFAAFVALVAAISALAVGSALENVPVVSSR